MSRIVKILYVEDDADDAEIFRSMLQVVNPTGFHLTVVRSAKQAMLELERGIYDLLIVDYWLQQTDKATARKLITHVASHTKYLPMAILTGDPSKIDDEVRVLIQAGRLELLSKLDLSVEQLQQVAEHLVDQSFTVLIFDDDGDEHLLIEQYLGMIDHVQFNVTHAFNEQDASTLLEHSKFDVVLLDWMTPRGDSRDVVATAVRANPKGCVMLVTNSAFEDIPHEVTDLVSRRNLAYLCKSFMDSKAFAETLMTQLYRTHSEPTLTREASST